MKLLIVTQVIDKNHPVLGFFHRWVEEFAKNCESVEVICLYEGEHSLPENVTVHSLGKEKGTVSILVYTWRLNRLSWKLRGQYDAVFVHMNPEYILAGFYVWKLLHKKIGLWYTHGSVSKNLRRATYFVDYIFTAAKEGCNFDSKKIIVTGHGIDVSEVEVTSDTKDIKLLSVGRITKSKNLEALVNTLELLRRTHMHARLTFIGVPITDEENAYKEDLDAYIKQKNMTAYVQFLGSVPHHMLPDYFNRTQVFVSAAQNGSLDKALIEPLMCGVPVVTSAPGARSLPLDDWQVHTTQEFAQAVGEILNEYPTQRMQQLQEYVQKTHSLPALIPKICYHYH